MKKYNANFVYQGYSIPKSFILKLKYKLNIPTYELDRIIFWCVQYCDYKKKQGVEVPLIKAIQSGLHKKWVFKLIYSDYLDKKYVEWWIDREIYHRAKAKPKRGEFVPAIDRTKLPDSVATILKELL